MYIGTHHPTLKYIWCHLGCLICKPPQMIYWQPPSKASWAWRFVNNRIFQPVNACHVNNKRKSEMVFLNYAPTNFSLR
jgi:hypothetical protein